MLVNFALKCQTVWSSVCINSGKQNRLCSVNTHCLTKVYLQIKKFQGNHYQSPFIYTEIDDIILCNFACVAKYLFWSVSLY